MANLLTALFWVLLTLLGVLVGALQRRGRDYYPANLLMGLAIGTQGVFWVGLLPLFGFSVPALRLWAGQARAGLWANGVGILLLFWALWLVWQTNHARRGSAMDLTGHASPPTPGMVNEAASVIAHARDEGTVTTGDVRVMLDRERALDEKLTRRGGG